MKYPNVWPTILSSNDGLKLVLGMLSHNALLASSIRLDQFELPKVGTTNFVLNCIKNSLAIRTCLHQKSVNKVLELAKNYLHHP
ncbi:hypothetical protein G6F57_004868 [Rhizopus arrhizus]|uniref:Uncharacterized protein n=1 Tax=Rhizopus oryzae TaxID=64495 RepID=A0A9P6XE59_RHIOR|nr:hypothetical protein G6F24_004494 [Rhizopus arrhizus]KAG1398540.1 hypothetical protein G6F58_011300 [Rhizopus delemar]KAG0791914.1 hypothetical protein G6F21_004743 [Rhizopus arrhizus]KAG0802211.1 hypothetical protein G6F22_000487 [Rhizopus arrhizus]KAG0819747.1 hypothetical protein G6F20_000490 [Rhizopus arrhizus]